ncbi:MAG: four helix bundle protein [Anaerolineales bacterium]|nr:four helix bundle protein [Anaerolineales bacterium]
MAIGLEDLQVLKTAELIADSIWKRVGSWNDFAKDTVGKQITRAADSIGANIAESFGRYNFGEKIQFLYYSRGSLFEAKYWLNRAKERDLMKPNEIHEYVEGLTTIARQLNSFAAALKSARANKSSAVREPVAEYVTANSEEFPPLIFSDDDLDFLGN